MAANLVSAERWQQVKLVVQDALGLSAAERGKYLEQACGSDPALMAEVEALLQSCEDAEDFLESPAALGLADDQENDALAVEVNSWIGPYKILETLGRGGMGVVYRAFDPKLERDVALKFLSADLSHDEKACERLYREARATSALNHPNIRRVYDICDYAGQTFIVLEFLEGRSLERRAKSALPVSELLSVATQICSALAAAHAKGIIHRDIKPANIFIDDAGQVSVLDFGIAKMVSGSEREGEFKNLTHPAMALGTISYMSPEQARGEELDPRTDLFSLGTLLFELATGDPPFTGPTNAVVFDQILNKVPPSISQLRPDFPATLNRLIGRLLQKDRANRYQSAAELLADLAAIRRELEITEPTSANLAVQGLSRSTKLRLVFPAAIAMLVLLALAGLYWLKSKNNAPAQTSTPPRSVGRRSIAVLGFKDLRKSPETAWLSTALSEMLTAQLGAGQSFRIVSGEEVARTKGDLALLDGESYSKPTLARIRANLGADYIVLGSYLDSGKSRGGTIRLYLKLQDAGAGETIASVSQNGSEEDLFDLVSRTATDLRITLGVVGASSSELQGVKASLATNPGVARLYSEGLDKLRLYEDIEAKNSLERAVALDPTYPLAHAALSEAWANLGYDQKARVEAKQAFEFSKGLLREGRLWVEGQYRTTIHDFERAVEVYKTLLATSPEDIGYALRLAAAETRAGKTADAFKTIETLRKLPAPYCDDPGIDLAESEAAAKDYKYDRELASAEHAAEKARAMGAKLLLSRALLRKSNALEIQGRRSEGLSAAAEARRIFDAVGDIRGAARATMAVASVLLHQSDMADALDTYRDAISLFRKTGDESGAALALTDAAIAQDELGDLAGGMRSYREALAIRRRIGDTAGVAQTLANVGFNLYVQGDLVGARKALDEGIPLAQSIGYKRVAAVQISTMGEIEMNLGHLPESEKLEEESLATFKEIGDKNHTASAHLDTGLALGMEGKFEQAHQRVHKAEALWNDLHDPIMAALARVADQDLTLKEGKTPADDKLLQEAQESSDRKS